MPSLGTIRPARDLPRHRPKYFIGMEAVDEEGLKHFRKRMSLDRNFEALEFARSLGLIVAINIIADPPWDRRRFEVIRQWCLEIPDIVNTSVTRPYPGTEIWHCEARRLTTRDYRLFDIQHAVLLTALPLEEFYEDLVKTQQALNRKHLGWNAIKDALGLAPHQALHGQTNFLTMIWKFNSVFSPKLQLADKRRKPRSEMPMQPEAEDRIDRKALYVHTPPDAAAGPSTTRPRPSRTNPARPMPGERFANRRPTTCQARSVASRAHSVAVALNVWLDRGKPSLREPESAHS